MGTQPLWVLVTYAAWIATGLYFLVSIFRTRRIAWKESGGTLVGERFVIVLGYVLLFAQFPARFGLEAHFITAHAWRQGFGIAGAMLAVVGLSYTCWSRATLGQYWSGIVALKKDHQLVESGPYAAVRHPLYTGLLAATLGVALATGYWRALLGAAILWSVFISRAFREDRLLAGAFGEKFEAYRARTGRLLPRLGD